MSKFSGSLEVICGSMFSGKSEELIRRLKRGVFAKKKVLIFKPGIDNRYKEDSICSHDGNSLEAISITRVEEIIGFIPLNPDIIGIDEVQFLEGEVVEIIDTLLKIGIRVIVSGLDMDYQGEPFRPIPELLAVADRVTKLQAICSQCGENAVHSAKLNKQNRNLVDIGEADKYQPLCRDCFLQHNKE